MKKFEAYAVCPAHPAWAELTARRAPLYEHDNLRDCFYRDYTRILHSTAFRRLKHKTQVFPHVEGDHICTRMEHVLHVESVSTTIAEELGLSLSLTRAIALGHDVGHAPFGHQGEAVIAGIAKQYLGEPFFHEKNGLRFVDDIELLGDPEQVERNLCLTYAVRDGILSHCGEMDKNGLRPRRELFDLSEFRTPGAYESATWEGCVVKMADKIAYLARDIEDAEALGLLSDEARRAYEALRLSSGIGALNTSGFINDMICDICAYSDPEHGISLSPRGAKLLDETKNLNYRYIYKNPVFDPFRRYSELVIREVFEALLAGYTGEPYRVASDAQIRRFPTLFGGFDNFVRPYTDRDLAGYANTKLYGDLSDKNLFIRAAIDYLSGMTDAYLIRAYGELVSF